MTVKLEKDKTKAPLDLLPYAFLKAVADVRRHGDEKYGPLENLPRRAAREMVAAMIRHCYEYLAGSDKDHDSGLHPLAHVACGVAVVMYQLEKGTLVDDRVSNLFAQQGKALDFTIQQFNFGGQEVRTSNLRPEMYVVGDTQTGMLYFKPGFNRWSFRDVIHEVTVKAIRRADLDSMNAAPCWDAV